MKQNRINNSQIRFANYTKALTAFAISVFFSCLAQAQIINTLAGTGTPGFSGDGGVASAAKLYHPISVAIDGIGNLYISDLMNQRIRKVNTSGIITTFAGTGTAGFSVDGLAAIAADLHDPNAITVDRHGNLYYADIGTNRIRRIDAAGIITTYAGYGSPGFSGDGGSATAARLNNPYGLAVDTLGNLYIADCSNNRIRKVNTSGIISTIAGTGTAGFSGDSGAATAARFLAPNSIALDNFGNIYISDYGNHRIRKIDPSGIITTIAGNGSIGFSGDGGAATAAMLNYPTGVTVDVSGSVYIADESNQCIRKVNSAGIINTIAGNDTVGFSGDGGPATAAMLNSPHAVAVDNGGYIYIADFYNNRVRKVSSCFPALGAIVGASSVCVGATVALIDTPAGGTWTSNNTIRATVSTAGVVTGNITGSAVISYAVTNACGTTTVTHTIAVDSLPIVAAITGTDTTFVGGTTTLTCATSGGVWSSSNTAVASVSSSGVVRGVAAGTAVISYAVTNLCGTTVVARTVTALPNTGVTTLGISEAIALSPNPTGDILHIALPTGAEKATLTLTDLAGRVLLSQTATTLAPELNLYHLANGNYMLNINTPNRKWVQMVVKE